MTVYKFYDPGIKDSMDALAGIMRATGEHSRMKQDHEMKMNMLRYASDPTLKPEEKIQKISDEAINFKQTQKPGLGGVAQGIGNFFAGPSNVAGDVSNSIIQDVLNRGDQTRQTAMDRAALSKTAALYSAQKDEVSILKAIINTSTDPRKITAATNRLFEISGLDPNAVPDPPTLARQVAGDSYYDDGTDMRAQPSRGSKIWGGVKSAASEFSEMMPAPPGVPLDPDLDRGGPAKKDQQQRVAPVATAQQVVETPIERAESQNPTVQSQNEPTRVEKTVEQTAKKDQKQKSTVQGETVSMIGPNGERYEDVEREEAIKAPSSWRIVQ